MIKHNKRYCFVCDDFRTFQFNKRLNHSQCQECSSRFGTHPNNFILKHFLRKIEKIKNTQHVKLITYQNESLAKKNLHIKKLIKELETVKKKIAERKNH